MSTKSNLGFLNLSKFYRVSQKNLDPSLMGHKGCQKWHEDKSRVSLEKLSFYLSSEHKIMGLSEITHVTIKKETLELLIIFLSSSGPNVKRKVKTRP